MPVSHRIAKTAIAVCVFITLTRPFLAPIGGMLAA
jgi:hypothetical protein